MTDHGYAILRAEIGASCTELVGEYLPCEYPFMWHYPHVTLPILRRRTKLTTDEQLDFCYALLQDAKYRDELVFSEVLLQRALREGCRVRLDNLKPLIRHDARVRYFDDVCIEGMKWLVDNTVAVDQWELREYMIRTSSNYERSILMSLLKDKIDISLFDRPKMSFTALRWFFDHPYLLFLPRSSHVNLDYKSDAEVCLWLEKAPLEIGAYHGKRLIDYTDTAKMLDFLYSRLGKFRLPNFSYSEEAISLAIAENNIEVLKWWEQKSREENLEMIVPRIVYNVHESPSEEVCNWAHQYNVRLKSI